MPHIHCASSFMSFNLPSRSFVACHPLSLPRPAATPRGPIAISSGPQNTFGEERKNGRRIWRRRKLTKRDKHAHMASDFIERVPFLEEQVLKMQQTGALITADVDLLMLSEENKYAFTVDVAAEATALVQANPEKYGGTKKPILHALSNRMNDIGVYRPDAYVGIEPYKPKKPTVKGSK